VLVNVPAAREIAVVDVRRAAQVAAWPLADWHGNFPLAIDEGAQTVWVVTRQPAKLIAMDARSGIPKLVLNSCDDADDVLFDAMRHRLYIICGTGFIDVWQISADHYEFIAHQRTMAGARTALFVPQWDRLYLAVRAGPGSAAAIWVYRPTSP
jgi:hypothetical protein